MLASRSRVLLRGKTALAALLVALAAGAAARARAQVKAPKLVEESDETPEEPARPPPPAPAPPAAPAPASAAPGAPAASPPATPPAAAAPLPPPPPPPTAAQDLARRIVPVGTSWAALLSHWEERRTALHEGDPARAEAAQRALLADQRELAIENLSAFAAAEARAARRALAANLVSEAVSRADLAVALSPDLPDAHLTRARALLALGRPGPALAAAGAALAAAVREPHTIRAFYGDLASAGLAAIFTAAGATVLLLLLRRLRLFLHDFHHLPLLRGSASIQTGFLALVLLALPVAFGLGPFALLAVAALAAWLYLSLAERLVVTAALAAVLALPWAAAGAARLTAWTGSTAERVHEIEHGAISDQEAAETAAAPGPTPPALLAALGRHAKRRGDLEAALRLYRQALAAEPRAAELHVNIANVLFVKGDLEGAKAEYLAAQDQAGGELAVLGAAHYGLSKLYLRTSEMDKSAAVREKAEREAGEFLRARGSDEDFGANRYLVDVPVSSEKIAALAEGEGSAEAVQAWVRARVMGGLPGALWPWGGAACLALLWVLALVGPRLAPARACETCGRAACKRCDGAAGTTCGQCVNVFQKKGVVDARDRLRKEAQVRRHGRFVRAATRVLAVAGGGAGQVFHGEVAAGALLMLAFLFAGFVVWFWRGIMPPPQPSAYVLAGKLAVAIPLGLGLWALAVRDAFRRTED